MGVFATVLFTRVLFFLESRDMYIQRFSAISVIDCKSVFDFVTKPGAPTGIEDKCCATDMAIIRVCLRRMEVTLRWGQTGLMLGDALTKDKADASDLLRAILRINKQTSHPLCNGLEKSVRRKPMVKFEVTSDEWLTRTFLGGFVDVLPTEPSTTTAQGAHAGELPSHGRVVRLSVETREGKGDAAARGEHRQHPDHDGGILGGEDFVNVGGLGERVREMDARRVAH